MAKLINRKCCLCNKKRIFTASVTIEKRTVYLCVKCFKALAKELGVG